MPLLRRTTALAAARTGTRAIRAAGLAVAGQRAVSSQVNNLPSISTTTSTKLARPSARSGLSALSTESLTKSLGPGTVQRYSTADPEMYTASFAFFEALWEAGVTHCFVNLGSDHPSIIEAMVKGQREAKGNFPKIITCPNEVRTCHRCKAMRTSY